jgi:hypothetical protein
VRACPRCGHENPDETDFCEKCRTYLRWEPTRVVSAVPPPAETPASDEKAAGESDRT